MLDDSKKWQEVKIRKPNQEICNSLQNIIIDFSEISASKALEKLILNYPVQKDKFEKLQSNSQRQAQVIKELEIELANQKKLVADIRNSFKVFSNFISD